MGFGVSGAPEGSTGRLIFVDTFAACSNLSSSLVNVKVSGKMLSTSRLLRYDCLGNNVRREIHCLEATYVEDFLLNDHIFQLNSRVSGGISCQ